MPIVVISLPIAVIIALAVVAAGLILALPPAQGQVVAAKADSSAGAGANTQLYRHAAALSSPRLTSTPGSRVYLEPAAARAFIREYLAFTQGHVVSSDRYASSAAIGLPGTTFGEVLLSSPVGNTLVIIVDGALPYPSGPQSAGLAVTNLTATLAKATAAGAHILWGPSRSLAVETAIVQFPSGYIAEIHQRAQLATSVASGALAAHRN